MIDPARAGDVIELGPGTGSVTKALLARGVPQERLWLVEFDPIFCQRLRERFGLGDSVVSGDAYDLMGSLAGRLGRPVLAVVSSLPLLNEQPCKRIKLLDEAFALMGPDGAFVQFTYGVRAPISREACGGRYVARCGAPIFLNIPPASVWVYRRPEAAHAVDEEQRRNGMHGRFALMGRHGERVREKIWQDTAQALARGRSKCVPHEFQ